jgi:hypothetical protein
MKLSMWSRLHRLVNRIAATFCRHPAGIVCAHRAYDADLRTEGYLKGLRAGQEHVEAKWLGSVSGEGPYANYPAPRPAP